MLVLGEIVFPIWQGLTRVVVPDTVFQGFFKGLEQATGLVGLGMQPVGYFGLGDVAAIVPVGLFVPIGGVAEVVPFMIGQNIPFGNVVDIAGNTQGLTIFHPFLFPHGVGDDQGP